MTPGECPAEGAVLDGKKSYCGEWGRWTNCREAGKCLKPENVQMTIFDLMEGEDEGDDQ